MSAYKLMFLIVFSVSLSELRADIFSPSAAPSRVITSLEQVKGSADIVSTFDINMDGEDDFVVRYKDSSSSYGEFLYNVLVSADDEYLRGFIHDEYFVDLFFENEFVVGIRRDDNLEVSTYIFHLDEQNLLREKRKLQNP